MSTELDSDDRERYRNFLRWHERPGRNAELPDGSCVRVLTGMCPVSIWELIEAAVPADALIQGAFGVGVSPYVLQGLRKQIKAALKELESGNAPARSDTIPVPEFLKAHASGALPPAAPWSPPLRTEKEEFPPQRTNNRWSARWELCSPTAVTAALHKIAADSRRTQRQALLEVCHQRAVRQLPIARPAHLKALLALRSAFPNFEPAIDDIEFQLRLLIRLREPLHLQPMLLQGPPGIGKTHFAQSLALALSMGLELRSFAEMSASFVLVGLSSNWANSQAGAVATLCIEGKDGVAPLMMIDELDKASCHSDHPPQRALLSLLEPSSAGRFRDEFLNVEIDARPVSWLFTCNRLATIPPEVRSRMSLVRIPAPTPSQMGAVVRSIDAGLRRDRPGLARCFAALDAAVIDALAQQTPRELRRLLLRCYAMVDSKAEGRGRQRLTIDDVRRAVDHQRDRQNPATDKARPEPILLPMPDQGYVH